VVAARASSLPEVGGDAAVYVAPDDDVALATEIRRVLDDGAHHAALSAAAIAQSRRFSWDDTARATLAAFDDAMALAHGETTT
jgi:alpha-1,3-rhamnosyl/mannosyltransferase